MKKLMVLLLVAIFGMFIACEKENTQENTEVVSNDLFKNLLRIEAYLSIDNVDFTKYNGQVSLIKKDLLYMNFDTRDGDMNINENSGEIITTIDYVGFLGTDHKGSIYTKLFKEGNLLYVDYTAEIEDTAGTVITVYNFKVNRVPETSNVVIDDVTKSREISFELSGLEVCNFLTDNTVDPPVFNANYHFESPPFTEDMTTCDCSGESSLKIVFVYRET